MKKDFSRWTLIKKTLHDRQHMLHFHEREIWYVSLGVNIGNEQDGKGSESLRPVIILKKFNVYLFWAIPTTHRERHGLHYFRFTTNNGFTATAILSQIRTMDMRRLKYKKATIAQKDFDILKTKITSFLM